MRPVHWIHISDSHVRGSLGDDAHLARFRATIAEIERLRSRDVPIDFVVHTGDLVDDADATDARSGDTRRALAVLDALSMPWYLVGGNHDRRVFLDAAAKGVSGRVMMAACPSPDAAFEPGDEQIRDHDTGLSQDSCGDLELVFLNANPEDGEHDLHGLIGIRQIAALEHRIAALPGGRRLALFLHYPPLAQDADWTGRPDGGEALHRMLRSHANVIAGVFAGHVHRSIHQLRDGLLYVTAPALSRHFLLWPGQTEHEAVDDSIVGFHYVTVDEAGTRVQHHAFEFGASPAAAR